MVRRWEGCARDVQSVWQPRECLGAVLRHAPRLARNATRQGSCTGANFEQRGHQHVQGRRTIPS
jgi:hypothetical protein